MRGRFQAGYVDTLALERARNPHYEEYPAGVANERVDLPIVFGLVDFLLYVIAIFPFAAAYQACFFLWVLPIPFSFLSAVMPVGPVSAWYWRRTHPATSKHSSGRDMEALERSLIVRRQRLQELKAETVHVEAELIRELPKAGDLHFAFEAQIRQARQSRERIQNEIVRIDIELANLRISELDRPQTR
jgi:hypothetical protein